MEEEINPQKLVKSRGLADVQSVDNVDKMYKLLKTLYKWEFEQCRTMLISK